MSYPTMTKVYQILGDEYRFEVGCDYDSTECVQIRYFDSDEQYSLLNMTFSKAEAALIAKALDGLLQETA